MCSHMNRFKIWCSAVFLETNLFTAFFLILIRFRLDQMLVLPTLWIHEKVQYICQTIRIKFKADRNYIYYLPRTKDVARYIMFSVCLSVHRGGYPASGPRSFPGEGTPSSVTGPVQSSVLGPSRGTPAKTGQGYPQAGHGVPLFIPRTGKEYPKQDWGCSWMWIFSG